MGLFDKLFHAAQKSVWRGTCQAMKISYFSAHYKFPEMSDLGLALTALSLRPRWTVAGEVTPIITFEGRELSADFIGPNDKFSDIVRNVILIESQPPLGVARDAGEITRIVEVVGEEFH